MRACPKVGLGGMALWVGAGAAVGRRCGQRAQPADEVHGGGVTVRLGQRGEPREVNESEGALNGLGHHAALRRHVVSFGLELWRPGRCCEGEQMSDRPDPVEASGRYAELAATY